MESETKIEKEDQGTFIQPSEVDESASAQQEIYDFFFKEQNDLFLKEQEKMEEQISANLAQIRENLESIENAEDTDSISYKAKSAAKDVVKTVAENAIEHAKENAIPFATKVIKTMITKKI